MHNTQRRVKKQAALAIGAGLAVLASMVPAGATPRSINAEPTGMIQLGGAEIGTFNPTTNEMYVTNAEDNTLEVIDLGNPSNPVSVGSIDLAPYGGGVNSVDANQRIVVVAVEAEDKTENGSVLIFNRDLELLHEIEAGPLPDMVRISSNGQFIVVANEGEPNSDYTVDPEGSVTIIRINSLATKVVSVKTADFNAFDDQIDELRASGVRIFGPGASVSQDLEPEYVAIDRSARVAWVVLQENNALAVVDLRAGEVLSIEPLGFKDYSLPGNEIDASNRDDIEGNFQSWPVFGMYQPDAIEFFGGYLYTANEGDAREYLSDDEETTFFNEDMRADDLTLDPGVFPDAETLQDDANLGRLKVTDQLGDTDGDGDFDAIYNYGARSISVWDTSGNLVFDSGNSIERAVLANGTWEEDRSDDKGPEPEGLAVGRVGNRDYLFVGLERTSDVAVFDLSDRTAPELVQIISAPEGNVSPEGLEFVPKGMSPADAALLVVSYEVSATVQVFELTP